MRRALPGIWGVALATVAAQVVSAQNITVTLAWDANPERDIAGYRLYYGTASQTYTQHIDVGNSTTATISNLTEGSLYFFAATAYNTAGAESSFSNEAIFGSLPPTPTPIPSPSEGPVVNSLGIASNDAGGQDLMALVNGSVVNLATLPTQNINVQALVSGSNGISQVVFLLDHFTHSEATSPYALCGDWIPCPANTLTALGSHSLRVTAYDSAGSPGSTLLVTFTVINQPSSTPSPTTAPPLTPTPSPAFTPTPSPTAAPPLTPTPSPAFTPTPSPTTGPNPTPTPSPAFTPTPSPDPSATPILPSTPTPTPTSIPSPTAAPSPSPSGLSGLDNVSTRLFVQSDHEMVGGFIIYGDSQKRVILRAIGPSLAFFGVSEPLSDPVLRLFDSSGSVIASNDNWRSNQSQIIQDTGFAPTDDREAALVTTLPQGGYTAVVSDANNSSGVALFEFYDLDPANSQLLNLSTRGQVDAQERVMIGGFIINGNQSSRIILRALGSSLTEVGVPDALTDPTVELHNGDGALIAQNDDWRSDQEQQILDSGFAPFDDRESTIIATLIPGYYSAILRGAHNSTGTALFEIYKPLP